MSSHSVQESLRAEQSLPFNSGVHVVEPALATLLALARGAHFLEVEQTRDVGPALGALFFDDPFERGIFFGRPGGLRVFGLVVALPFILTLIRVTARNELADFFPVDEALGGVCHAYQVFGVYLLFLGVGLDHPEQQLGLTVVPIPLHSAVASFI